MSAIDKRIRIMLWGVLFRTTSDVTGGLGLAGREVFGRRELA